MRLVVGAAGVHPVPSRTRQLSPSAPMVLGESSSGRVGHCQLTPISLLVPSSSLFPQPVFAFLTPFNPTPTRRFPYIFIMLQICNPFVTAV